ncbi:MAG: hypothetical protein ABW208_29940, partial [Pyrinomonadaceae bacterium]
METTLTLKSLLDAAGWALVHSLWQGALVAALYACFAALVPRRAAALRYAGGVAALLLLLLLPVLTAGLSPHARRDLFARESVLPEGAWADSSGASSRGAGGGQPPPGPPPPRAGAAGAGQRPPAPAPHRAGSGWGVGPPAAQGRARGPER